MQAFSRVTSTGFVRGRFSGIGVVRGNAAPKLMEDHDHLDHHDHHDHAHEDAAVHEFLAADGAPVSEALGELRAAVLEAAGNPVGELMTVLGNTLTDRALSAAEKAGRAREVQAKRAAEARMKGFEGDACGACGNFTLVRNGTCMKCNTCCGTRRCS